FTMKLSMDMNLTSSTLGTQKVTETMTASGRETLSPRRTQMDTTMNLAGLPGIGQTSTGGQAITMSIIVDYASTTGYVKMSGLSFLPGASADKWYSMSYASLGGFGADTSMYLDYSKLKDATFVGSETLNGVAVWHLRAKEDVNQSLSGL